MRQEKTVCGPVSGGVSVSQQKSFLFISGILATFSLNYFRRKQSHALLPDWTSLLLVIFSVAFHRISLRPNRPSFLSVFAKMLFSVHLSHITQFVTAATRNYYGGNRGEKKSQLKPKFLSNFRNKSSYLIIKLFDD